MTSAGHVWYVPFGSQDETLQPSYSACSDQQHIKPAEPFTISLDTVLVPQDHARRWRPHWPEGDRDLVVFSSVAVGADPKPPRVHYHGAARDATRPLTNFLSDTIYAANDYAGDRIALTLHVDDVDSESSERTALAGAFGALAHQIGGIFPLMLPFTAFAHQLGGTTAKLLQAVKPAEKSRIGEVVNLYPLTEHEDRVCFQAGRYVGFAQEVDGSVYTLGTDGRLHRDGQEVLDLAYVVFRVERADDQSPAFGAGQQAATEAATLIHHLTAGSTDPIKAPLAAVTETVQEALQLRDLRRYLELSLKERTNGVTDAEAALLRRLAQNPIVRQLHSLAANDSSEQSVPAPGGTSGA